jgi:hypothetical protein
MTLTTARLARVLALGALLGCNDPREPEEFDLLDPTACALDAGPFTADVDHPYFPLPVGREWILEGEEDGVTVRLERRVLDDEEKVGDVTTRVLEETELRDGRLVAVGRGFYAQAPDGSVCLFGERVERFDGGARVGAQPSWRADVAGNAPGLVLPGELEDRVRYPRTRAPRVSEELVAIRNEEVVITIPAGELEESLWLVAWDPLRGESSFTGVEEFYAEGIGLVVARPVELVSDTVR